MLSEINRTGNPREYFKKDLIAEIHRLKKIYGENTQPWIFGDWNEQCSGKSAAQEICHEFGLVNIFNYM